MSNLRYTTAQAVKEATLAGIRRVFQQYGLTVRFTPQGLIDTAATLRNSGGAAKQILSHDLGAKALIKKLQSVPAQIGVDPRAQPQLFQHLLYVHQVAINDAQQQVQWLRASIKTPAATRTLGSHLWHDPAMQTPFWRLSGNDPWVIQARGGTAAPTPKPTKPLFTLGTGNKPVRGRPDPGYDFQGMQLLSNVRSTVTMKMEKVLGELKEGAWKYNPPMRSGGKPATKFERRGREMMSGQVGSATRDVLARTLENPYKRQGFKYQKEVRDPGPLAGKHAGEQEVVRFGEIQYRVRGTPNRKKLSWRKEKALEMARQLEALKARNPRMYVLMAIKSSPQLQKMLQTEEGRKQFGQQLKANPKALFFAVGDHLKKLGYRYRGKTIAELIETDPHYVAAMLNSPWLEEEAQKGTKYGYVREALEEMRDKGDASIKDILEAWSKDTGMSSPADTRVKHNPYKPSTWEHGMSVTLRDREFSSLGHERWPVNPHTGKEFIRSRLREFRRERGEVLSEEELKYREDVDTGLHLVKNAQRAAVRSGARKAAGKLGLDGSVLHGEINPSGRVLGHIDVRMPAIIARAIGLSNEDVVRRMAVRDWDLLKARKRASSILEEYGELRREWDTVRPERLRQDRGKFLPRLWTKADTAVRNNDISNEDMARLREIGDSFVGKRAALLQARTREQLAEVLGGMGMSYEELQKEAMEGRRADNAAVRKLAMDRLMTPEQRESINEILGKYEHVDAEMIAKVVQGKLSEMGENAKVEQHGSIYNRLLMAETHEELHGHVNEIQEKYGWSVIEKEDPELFGLLKKTVEVRANAISARTANVAPPSK